MNRIEHYRKLSGLTQQQAADSAGWKYQSRWSGYERGDRTPDVHDAQIIVKVLNEAGAACSVEDVFPAEIATEPKPDTEAA
jgi:putative transcriptional regulator